MYCEKCGKEIEDSAEVCIFCGVPTKNYKKEQKNKLATVGFVLSFFFALPGLVCSILGLKKSKELDGKGKNLSIAGIVISVVSIIISFLYFL